MSPFNTISIESLARALGTARAPVIIDVRTNDDFALDPRLLPGSIRRAATEVADWSNASAQVPTLVLCQQGHKLSEGTAAWLRHAGVPATILEGGFEGWGRAGLPLVPAEKIPPRGATGGSVWVTRARPKIDRIACPWLIRRFVDPAAIFLFVSPAEVAGVAERFNATPFDIDGVFWSHRGERCTFDVMVEEFGLGSEPMLYLATMVRAADTSRLDLCPEAAGLLAASLGLSASFDDDLEQLAAGMSLYDSLYSWCRDARAETHNWPTRLGAAA